MPDYSKAKIYKIVSPSHPEEVYYGSTCEKISTRKAHHKYQVKQGIKISSANLLHYDDYVFILVENYPCSTIEELKKREYEIINSNPCVNRQKMFVGSPEAKERDRLYAKNKDRRKKTSDSDEE